ncbi:MAG: hypothetical protein WAX04_03725 [Oscillospiraceae bacterium]
MRQRIRIEDLYLALDNPRLTDSQNENEAIEKMVSEQKDKLVVLAEDIIEHGLSPLDVIAVYPSETFEGKFIVAEGNRRVTVIKILNNPELISNYNLRIYNEFRKLKMKYIEIESVEAYVFKNEIDQALIHWLQIRHSGKQKGKGLVEWHSIQKERFSQKIKGESKLLDFWAQLENYEVLEYDQITSITKTNWERILRPSGLEFLGIYKSGSQLLVPIDNIEEFKIKMKCVHTRLAGKTVGVVYDQEKIDQFFNEISEELYGTQSKNVQKNFMDSDYNETKEPLRNIIETSNLELSDASNNQLHDGVDPPINEVDCPINEVDCPINEVDPPINEVDPPINEVDNPTNEECGYKSEDKEESNRKNNKDIFNGCRTIIPRQLNIRSNNVRINRIIRELKELDVDDYPNSCGALLRILFELSAKYYVERTSNEDLTEKSFEDSLKMSANLLRSRKELNNSDHSAIMKEANNLRLLFNGYVHNTESYPSSESLKSIFKAHKGFVFACLK